MVSVQRFELGAFRPHVRVIALYSVIANLLIIAPSIHMLQVYDRVLASRSMSTLIYLTLIVVLALVVYGVADAIRARVATRAAAKYSVLVAPKLFARLGDNAAAAAGSGKALRDFSSARAFLGGRSFITLFDLPFIPVYTGIMFMLHWSIGLLTVLGIVALCLLSWLNIRATETDREKSRTAENDATGFAQAVFQRVEDMRAGGMLPVFLSIWGRKTATALKDSETASAKAAFYQALSKSFRQILQVIMMAWGAFLVLQDQMSAGMIFMSSMMSGKALGPIDQLIGGWEQISKGFAAIRDIEALTGDDKSISPRMTLPTPKGGLTARDITYVPDPAHPDRKVLAGISLDIQPGEAILVTGKTGAGKSTLLRILAGAITPTSGLVAVDGVECAIWPTAQWGSLVGYMPQEIEFFPGSIAANIARFDPAAGQDAVIEAARRASAHETIMALPDGYRTIVGTGAFLLSSGQKQKIALARALYGQPKILILDEPNASLDQAGESALLAAIAELRLQGCAVVLAAHRNSVLRVVDRVFVLKQGQLQPLQTGRKGEGQAMARAAAPDAAPEHALAETGKVAS